MNKLVTFPEFAKLAGIDRSTVYRIAKHTLKNTVIGKRIDIAHPDAVNYLEAKASGKSIPTGGAAQRDQKKKNTGLSLEELNPNIADMTLREVVNLYGTESDCSEWLKAMGHIEQINERQLKNKLAQDELVSRELVQNGVIEPVNKAHELMMRDGSKTITKRITAMYDADKGRTEIELFVTEQIASYIRPLKSNISNRLLSQG